MQGSMWSDLFLRWVAFNGWVKDKSEETGKIRVREIRQKTALIA